MGGQPPGAPVPLGRRTRWRQPGAAHPGPDQWGSFNEMETSAWQGYLWGLFQAYFILACRPESMAE